jgi:hypothetical protein
MMTNRSLAGGAPLRSARSTRLCMIDGEAVVCIPLSDGQEALVSKARWDLLRALGYGSSYSADENGSGRFYARTMACDPSPDTGRSRSVSLARLVLASQLVAEEKSGGPMAPAKGWLPRPLNGNTLDCRDSNLVSSPASGCRNSFRAVWGVRERWALIASSQDPNRVFAERRRRARTLKAKCAGAPLERDTRALLGSTSPRPAPTKRGAGTVRENAA